MNSRGFTLLEVLVASLVMGVAVVGLLSNISTSTQNVARLTEYDRAALLARQKMDELLLDAALPQTVALQGAFDRAASGGVQAGWRASVEVFEAPPGVAPGVRVLQRIHVEVWWQSGARRRTLAVDGYRRAILRGPA